MSHANLLISPLPTNPYDLEQIAPERLRGARILVVDDIKFNLKMICSNLQARGYQNIIQATGGREALEMTMRLAPDLVILDLMMPDMDGFAYCEAIRAVPRFALMPIIVQTALDEMEHKINAFRVGASDYIIKPVDGRELEARVQVHLTNTMLMRDIASCNVQIMQEMRAAKTMQDRLMPSEQQLKACKRLFELNIGSYFETSSTLGGDCWGMRPISDSKLAIFMYDFSGHGITAAMNIFRMHTIMREFKHVSGDPGSFLSMLNHHLYSLLERTDFATMFYGVVDIETNCLHYACAGVPSPVLFSHLQQQAMFLNGRGFPLGVVPNANYTTQYSAFMPGDMVVFFSDCLTETRNDKGEFIADDAILHTVHTAATAAGANPAYAVIEGLKQLLRSQGDAPLMDDMTMNAYHRYLRPEAE